MNKTKVIRILTAVMFAALLLPLLAPIVRSASTTMAQIVQSVSLAAETSKVIGTVNVSAGQTIAAVTAITNALPAGSNIIGNVRIDQTTPGTTNGVVATLNAETTKVIGTVNISAGQSITAVTGATVSVPVVAKVGATTTSGQLVAADATRKAMEIDCDCANTDGAAIKWGAAAAVYANDKQLMPCSNWAVPPGITVQTAVQFIAQSGTQNCRVITYP